MKTATELKCWYCGASNLRPEGGHFKCADCGATMVHLPAVGSSPLTGTRVIRDSRGNKVVGSRTPRAFRGKRVVYPAAPPGWGHAAGGDASGTGPPENTQRQKSAPGKSQKRRK